MTLEERQEYKRVALNVLKDIATGRNNWNPVAQEQQISAAHTILMWVVDN